jgi:hypothetical protein
MKVRDVMTKNPFTVSPDDSISTAIDLIEKHHVWTIPVVSEGKLIGVITKQDIKNKMAEPNQKISELMSTPAFTISPEDELTIASEKLKSLRINTITVVEGFNIVGILTRSDIHKKSLVKIGECHYCYPRGDKRDKELTQCKYCNKLFCTDHYPAKKPMAAPFKSTEVDERKEWEKKGHPCVPYYDAIRDEEKYLRKEPYQSYGNGIIKIEPPLSPEPELSTIPSSKPSSGKENKPKIKEPITVEKKLLYKHSKKFISWFFWKKHHHSKLRKKDFLTHLTIIVVLSLIFLFVYLNSNTFNRFIIYFLKLGSLIEVCLAIVIIYYFYKIIINLRYGIRGLANGFKVIAAVVFLLFCFQICLQPSIITNPISEFDYTTLNPIATNWNPSDSNTYENEGNGNSQTNTPEYEQLLTGPNNITLSYIYNTQHRQIDYTVYRGLNDFLSSLPRTISYYYIPPTTKDFIMRDINQEKQKEFLMPLVQKIQNVIENDDDQAKIAISIVQNIPYDWSGFTTGLLTGKFPYEVLYTQRGVCGEKSELLVFLLRELGYGVVTFEYANHRAVGVKCPIQYSYDGTGYCFVESTMPSIITDSEMDYVGTGKLGSYTMIEIADGKSLNDISDEYNDAREYIRLNELIESSPGGVLSQYDYNQWWTLVNKYGINIS